MKLQSLQTNTQLIDVRLVLMIYALCQDMASLVAKTQDLVSAFFQELSTDLSTFKFVFIKPYSGCL